MSLKEFYNHKHEIDQKNLKVKKNFSGQFSEIFRFQQKLIWSNIIVIIGFHAVAIYAILTFPYHQQIVLTIWGYVVGHLSGVGVTAGVHRLWTHRTYKAKPQLRILLAFLYATAGQNRIYDWVRDHRVHHKAAETSADPHNSNRGFWFSHVGWLMMKKHPDVYKQGKAIDMSDIESDNIVRVFDKFFLFFKITCCFVIPVVIPVYFWNQPWMLTIMSQIFIRYPVVLNSTWAVNSFAHIWGYRSFDKSIRPAENLAVSLMSVGEGYHNYHHVFPWDYKAAEFGHVVFNPTKLWIDFFEKIGWAYDLKHASPELIKSVVENRGDGTYTVLEKL